VNPKQLVNALAYELAIWLIRRWPALRANSGLRRVLTHCKADWIEWKVSRVMRGVDDQVEQLQQDWAALETKKHKPVFSESPPDDSKAQELLGGELRLRAPWVKE